MSAETRESVGGEVETESERRQKRVRREWGREQNENRGRDRVRRDGESRMREERETVKGERREGDE